MIIKKKLKMIKNNKFKILNESLRAMKDNCMNIIILYGSAGFGKTFTTLKYLKKQEMNYTYINSYSTALSFYEILYNSRNKDVVVFDDLSGMNNQLIISLLKSACWTSDGERIVSYYSTSSKMDLKGLPENFVFNASVILIFNLIPVGYEPLNSRGISINFDFNFKEKLEIFDSLKDFIDEGVLNYIKETCDESTMNLSIRTLITLSKLKLSGRDYKLLSKEMLKRDEDKRLLIEMTCREWCDTTGKHVATYYRRKKKLL